MIKNELKTGFTTGVSAQAATKGACYMLVNQKIVDSVEVEAPSGIKLNIELQDQQFGKRFAKCAVIKKSCEGGDVTNGAKIFARVRLSEHIGVSIKGSEGVGKVTKPGLAMGMGEWAINPVPRKMIFREASLLLPKNKGFEVTISVPGGKKIAEETYNPRLGIIGGISIIGTTGIVEPKSLDAYRASLALELDVLRAEGHKEVALVLGYVGERYAKEFLKLKDGSIIKIGDHVGFMLEQCAIKNIKNILLIGHIGKLIKLTAGQFNTHYKFGDNRVSLIAGYAKLYGADKKIVKDILSESTAEATIEILNKAGLMKVFERIAQEVSLKAVEFVNNKVKISTILLSLEGRVLAQCVSCR